MKGREDAIKKHREAVARAVDPRQKGCGGEPTLPVRTSHGNELAATEHAITAAKGETKRRTIPRKKRQKE